MDTGGMHWRKQFQPAGPMFFRRFLRFSNSDSVEIENLKRQLQDSKSDMTKLNEELASNRKKLLMRKTELQALKSELSSKNNIILSLQAYKAALQRELETLKPSV